MIVYGGKGVLTKIKKFTSFKYIFVTHNGVVLSAWLVPASGIAPFLFWVQKKYEEVFGL